MSWPFRSRRDAGDREASRAAQARAEESRRHVERGGLPLRAQERMRHLAESGCTPWGSALTTADHALLVQAGMRPLGHVMGTSFTQIAGRSAEQSLWGVGGRTTGLGAYRSAPGHAVVDWLVAGRRTAYRNALRRLEEEATILGADLVLGVEIRVGGRDWASGAVEVWTGGTAVKVPGWPEAERAVTSTLRAEDAVKLHAVGCRPARAVVGIAAIVAAEGPDQRGRRSTFLGSGFRNSEMTDWTALTYRVRHAAMRDAIEQATAAGASGIVGVAVEHDVEREAPEGWELRLATMRVVATAIAGSPGTVPPVHPVLDLTTTPRSLRR